MAITNFSVKGLDGLLDLLGDVSDATSDRGLGLALDAATASLLSRIRTRFREEKDVNGVAWPKSAAAREAGRRTLFKTGRLFQSIQAFNVNRNTRGVGTDVPYAKFHQNGTRYLPKRSFIGANDEDVEVILNVFLTRIRSAIRG